MQTNTTQALTNELFQFMKQLPRLKLICAPVDGLSRTESELLVLLVMNMNGDKKALSVSEISSLLRITPAGVTHLINPLENAGHIVRLPDPTDRRIVLIGVTDKGSEVAAAVMEDIQARLAGLVDHLGEEDCKTFIRLVSQVLNYLTV